MGKIKTLNKDVWSIEKLLGNIKQKLWDTEQKWSNKDRIVNIKISIWQVCRSNHIKRFLRG